jgi:hypothetical protein
MAHGRLRQQEEPCECLREVLLVRQAAPISQREVNAGEVSSVAEDVVTELMGAAEPLTPCGPVGGDENLKGAQGHVHGAAGLRPEL